MQQDYSNMTIREFIDAVSAETPTPGGGSVCGVVGAMAGALTAMCSSYALHRERFAAISEEAKTIHARAEHLRDRCLSLSVEDAVTFQRVMEVLKEPKGTPDEERTRRAHIDTELARAADVLVHTAKAGREIAALASRLVDIGNPSLRADAVVASELAEVVVRGCIDQIRDNLQHIKDEELKKKVADQLTTLA
jgi:formiminotetrahydrofolate cyclodeaminase